VVGSQAQRDVTNHLCSKHSLSERKACELSRIKRSTYRYKKKEKRADNDFKDRLKKLAYRRKTFGYRRLHVLLKREGFTMNHKKFYRIYREEGLSRRRKKKKRYQERFKRPLEKPSKPNQRWAMDFVSDSLNNGSKVRMLNIVDVFTKECPAIVVSSSLPSSKVISTLDYLAETRGLPEAITVDNGPEYTSEMTINWAKERGVFLDHITPGKPTENGYIESFNGKFREECLDQNWFRNLKEAKRIVEDWRQDYNKERPHSAIGYMTPEEFARKKAIEMFTSRSQTFQQLTARPFTNSQGACELVNNLADEEIIIKKREKVYFR